MGVSPRPEGSKVGNSKPSGKHKVGHFYFGKVPPTEISAFSQVDYTSGLCTMKLFSLDRLRHAPQGDDPAEIYGYIPYLVALSGAWLSHLSCFGILEER